MPFPPHHASARASTDARPAPLASQLDRTRLRACWAIRGQVLTGRRRTAKASSGRPQTQARGDQANLPPVGKPACGPGHFFRNTSKMVAAEARTLINAGRMSNNAPNRVT
jgi:hypothetical protein